jgi:hypothetical protein
LARAGGEASCARDAGVVNGVCVCEKVSGAIDAKEACACDAGDVTDANVVWMQFGTGTRAWLICSTPSTLWSLPWYCEKKGTNDN